MQAILAGINDLKGRFEDAEARRKLNHEEMTGKVSTLTGKVSTMQGYVIQTQGYVIQTQGQVVQMKEQIIQMQAKLTRLETQVNRLETQVNQNHKKTSDQMFVQYQGVMGKVSANACSADSLHRLARLAKAQLTAIEQQLTAIEQKLNAVQWASAEGLAASDEIVRQWAEERAKLRANRERLQKLLRCVNGLQTNLQNVPPAAGPQNPAPVPDDDEARAALQELTNEQFPPFPDYKGSHDRRQMAAKRIVQLQNEAARRT